jgi:hypothetical protein
VPAAQQQEAVLRAAIRNTRPCKERCLTPPSSGRQKGCAFLPPLMSNVRPHGGTTVLRPGCFIAALASLLTTGCFLISEDPYTSGDLRRTVLDRGDGRFLVSFPIPVVDRLDADPMAAVSKYLSVNQLTPSACTKGVTVLSRGAAQGGYHGVAIFRCSE